MRSANRAMYQHDIRLKCDEETHIECKDRHDWLNNDVNLVHYINIFFSIKFLTIQYFWIEILHICFKSASFHTDRKRYPKIIHQYDVWHISKWITKNLTQKAKKKGNEDLSPWIKCITNHLWWCAQSCNKDAKVLVGQWVSIVNHVSNTHQWKEGKKIKKCQHHKLSKKEQKKKCGWSLAQQLMSL